MQIERAFEAPFRDKRWYVQALWAGLWTGLGVTSPAVSGYALDYVRNVAHGCDTPLPEWNRGFGRWWVRGFLLAVAGTLYALPALVLIAIGTVPLVAATLAAAASDGSADAFGGAIFAGGTTLCVTYVLASFYLIALTVFFYGAYVNYAMSENFGALFRVKEILARIRTARAGYFTAWAMSLVFAFAAGSIAGFIGWILGATGILSPLAGFVGGAIGFLATLMSSHLFGQYACTAYAVMPSPVVVPAPPAPPSPAVLATPNPASSAHSEPDSPMPSYSPEQMATPSGPDSDPPAENGGP